MGYIDFSKFRYFKFLEKSIPQDPMGFLGVPRGPWGGLWGPGTGSEVGPPTNALGPGIPGIRTVPRAPERVRSPTGSENLITHVHDLTLAQFTVQFG